MLAVHERLAGIVLASHWRAIRTLQMMGFKLGPRITLPTGAVFLEFFKERNVGVGAGGGDGVAAGVVVE